MRHFSSLHVLSFLVAPVLVAGGGRVRPGGTAKEAHHPAQP